jgi:salicylate hydroxylase
MCWRSTIKYDHELFHEYDLVFVRGNQQFMYILNLGGGYTSWISRKLTSDCSLSTTAEETKSRILHELADWEPSFRAVVEATPAEKIWEGPICDRPPLNNWSKGRVTLVGDAAHPMAPSLGQGTNSTFEDVYELALCFSQSSSVQAAFTQYTQRRVERIKIIQARSAVGEMAYYEINTDKSIQQTMRYYHSDAEKAWQQTSTRPLQNEEFRNWLYSYKPTVEIIN